MFDFRGLLLVVLFAAVAVCGVAGPVPGVDSRAGSAVVFAHPEHISILDLGNDEYRVTFRWTPLGFVKRPCLAGSFNDWSRGGITMTDEDNDGTFEVTLRLGGGKHFYKFVQGSDGWYTDEKNPLREDDGHGGANSILILGKENFISEIDAKRGDSKMEVNAFKHDPSDVMYFENSGNGKTVFRLRTLKDDVESVNLRFLDNGHMSLHKEKMILVASDHRFDFYETAVSNNGLLFDSLDFRIDDGAKQENYIVKYKKSLLKKNSFKTPEWAKSAIWYQIMVDRFYDGDGKNNPEFTKRSSTKRSAITHPWTADWYDEQLWERQGKFPDGSQRSFWRWSMYDRMYGGDFEGVIQKLDYVQGLGANAIYLNPVFESGNAHKYNARSYVFADDGYGVPGEFDKAMKKVDLLDASTWYFNESDKKLLKLIDACHERGMKIILDGVFNHLGSDSPTFLDVKKNGKKSKFADWYDIKSWEPFEYNGWGGFDGLPEFRKNEKHGLASESLRQHIFDVTRRWMDPNGDGDPSDGIDGWRLDVPMHVPKPFWVEWRKLVKSINPDAYIVGEIWDAAEEWLDGSTFDAVMNYPFSKSAFRFFGDQKNKITASEFDRELGRLRIRYPRAATYALQNLYDSHDTDRWVSRLANPDMGYDQRNRKQDTGPDYMDKLPAEVHFERLKLMAVFQATYIGAPMIWYGTEVGMFGADDPMCRMPMWWEDMMPFANENYKFRNDVKQHFQCLFKLRAKLAVLNSGDYLTLAASDAQDCFAFLRYMNNAAVVVVLNNSRKNQLIKFSAPDKSILQKGFVNPKVLFGEVKVLSDKNSKEMRLDIGALGGAIIRIDK